MSQLDRQSRHELLELLESQVQDKPSRYAWITTALKGCPIRRILYCSGDAPLNYAEFLRYTTSRHLTRQVGGGFVFRHRMLMEHFAESDW